MAPVGRLGRVATVAAARLFCVLGRLPLLLSFRRRNLRGLTAACAPVALGLDQPPCVCFDFGSTANILVVGNGIRRPLQ